MEKDDLLAFIALLIGSFVIVIAVHVFMPEYFLISLLIFAVPIFTGIQLYMSENVEARLNNSLGETQNQLVWVIPLLYVLVLGGANIENAIYHSTKLIEKHKLSIAKVLKVVRAKRLTGKTFSQALRELANFALSHGKNVWGTFWTRLEVIHSGSGRPLQQLEMLWDRLMIMFHEITIKYSESLVLQFSTSMVFVLMMLTAIIFMMIINIGFVSMILVASFFFTLIMCYYFITYHKLSPVMKTPSLPEENRATKISLLVATIATILSYILIDAGYQSPIYYALVFTTSLSLTAFLLRGTYYTSDDVISAMESLFAELTDNVARGESLEKSIREVMDKRELKPVRSFLKQYLHYRRRIIDITFKEPFNRIAMLLDLTVFIGTAPEVFQKLRSFITDYISWQREFRARISTITYLPLIFHVITIMLLLVLSPFLLQLSTAGSGENVGLPILYISEEIMNNIRVLSEITFMASMILLQVTILRIAGVSLPRIFERIILFGVITFVSEIYLSNLFAGFFI